MTEKENLIMLFCGAVKNASTAEDISRITREELPAETPLVIPDFILDYCEKHGISRSDPALAFIEQHAQETRAREAKSKRENIAADLSEKIAHYKSNLSAGVSLEDPDLIALGSDISKQAAALGENPAIVDRIGSWDSFITECKTYEPEKDFRPELFDRLPFPPGTVSYIGARAKVGKTTAMINLCREALFNNRKTFFITLEMSRKQLLVKLILCTAYSIATDAEEAEELDKVDTPQKDCYALIKGTSIENECFKKYVTKAIDLIKPWYKNNFMIYDGRGARFPEIISAITANVKPETLVLLDYIQRMPPVDEIGSDNYMRVKKISDGVMNAAAQTNSIIISGAQFNRTVVKNTDGEEVIELHQYREAGDIEQDGHNLIGIGRLAGKGTRYIKMLAARESLVEDNAYSLHFAGGYSYMAKNEEIKAPEESPRKTGSGISLQYLSKDQKQTLKDMADEMREENKLKKKPKQMTPEEREAEFKKEMEEERLLARKNKGGRR
jgi:hypothetical protein